MKLSIIINTYNRKDMLYALLRSILACRLPEKYEIIVVDDCSEDIYEKELHAFFPEVSFLRTPEQFFLIKARNLGWQKANGEYVFFIDDDNEIKDSEFFQKGLKLLEENERIGVMGCWAYYFNDPEYGFVGPSRFSKLTGKTFFYALNKKDEEVPDMKGLKATHDTPNAFFMRKSVLEKTGGFSPEIVQTFSEADLAEKVRLLGYEVMSASELRVYHKSEKINFQKLSARAMGGKPERLYYLMRNRFVFIKKWGNFMEKLLFSLLFAHVFTFYYLWHLARAKEWKMSQAALRGIRDGYFYMLGGKLKNYYERTK